MLEKQDLQGIQNLINTAEQRIANNTKAEINGVYTYLENRIEPQLKLLAEGQQAILEQLAPKSRLEDLEDEVKLLKIVIKQMNEEINALKAG